MVEAIVLELERKSLDLQEENVATIYFGGGTPSVLQIHEVQSILTKINSTFQLVEDVEITFEANPDDVTAAYLAGLRTTGVNRISLGIQSFFERDLTWMNRSHNVGQAFEAIRLTTEAGFKNVNIDLIYGLPGMKFSEWRNNVEELLKTDVNHLSAYHLTVEEKTLLNHQVKIGKVKLPPDNQSIEEVEWLENRLNASSWERYEISNFCVNEAYAVHNTNYWLGKKYMGVGPSAHSYFGDRRTWNVKNNALYVKKMGEGETCWETEILTQRDLVNEAIMLGLRTKWGVNMEKVKNLAEVDFWKSREKMLAQFQQANEVQIDSGCLKLTAKGKLLADHIASELFWDE